MVKPGGTGRPRLAISARLAPLPPSRSRMSALPSALPSPNVNTHLPALAATGAALAGTAFFAATFGATGLVTAFAATLAAGLAVDFTAGLAAALATGFGALLASALRAAGAAFALAEGFDFAAVLE